MGHYTDMFIVPKYRKLQLMLQWNLYIMDNLVQELSSIIRIALLGGFIIAWVWLFAKIDDVL